MYKKTGFKIFLGLIISSLLHGLILIPFSSAYQKQQVTVNIKLGLPTTQNKSVAPLPKKLPSKKKVADAKESTKEAPKIQSVDWQEILDINLQYPAKSVDQREQGTVEVLASFNQQGHFKNLKILKSSGHARLDLAIERALQSARIKAEKMRRIQKNLHLTFEFRLN